MGPGRPVPLLDDKYTWSDGDLSGKNRDAVREFAIGEKSTRDVDERCDIVRLLNQQSIK